MAEKNNISVADEAIDNGQPVFSAAPQNETVSAERNGGNASWDFELEAFIREEKNSFDARYAEIMSLVDKVGTASKSPSRREGAGNAYTHSASSSDVDRSGNGEDVSGGIVLSVKTSQDPHGSGSSEASLLDADHDLEYRKLQKGILGAGLEPYGEKAPHDVSEYSAALADGESFDSDKDDHDSFDEHYHGYRYESMDLFARSELTRNINSFYRRQSAFFRQISKLEVRQKNADSERNISLIVEKISVMKELCELTVEILSSCVYLEAKGKTARFKRILKSNIDKYNLLCDEYEGASGRMLERLEYGIIDDVMAGKIARPIPNVYYYGSEDEAVYDHRDEEFDRIRRIEEEEDLLSREYERYLDGGIPIHLSDSERAALAKRKNEKLSAIKRATERDVLLVGLRSEYLLSELEAERDIMVRSYGLDKRKTVKSIRTVERKIEKISKNTGKAIKIARENNSRYYLLCALDPAEEKVKSGARRERLDALRARLNTLLSERESVNDRLIALYGGSDRNLKRTEISRKAAKIRRRSATAMYNRQRKLAKKIDKYRVPSDMKERAFDLLNKKTQAAATADECIYKLKKLKPIGRAKRELILEIRKARSTIRKLDREIRYMLAKLKRNQERYEDNKEWAAVLAFSFVVIAIGAVLWVAFGQNVTAYFARLAEQLGGA